MTRLRIVVILSEAKDLFVKICAVLDNEKYVGDILLMKNIHAGCRSKEAEESQGV